MQKVDVHTLAGLGTRTKSPTLGTSTQLYVKQRLDAHSVILFKIVRHAVTHKIVTRAVFVLRSRVESSLLADHTIARVDPRPQINPKLPVW